LLNDYPIIIGTLSTSQTNSTSTTIFFAIHSYSINTCNQEPGTRDGPGPCYTYLIPRILN